jgi:O-antigen/teichoic acid export membrane protein
MATLGVQAVEILAQILVSIIIARRLGPSALGEFVFAMGAAGMLSVLMQFGTGDVAIKFLVDAPAKSAAIIAASQRFVWRGTAVAILIALGIAVVIQLGAREMLHLALAVAILVTHARAAVLNNVILARGWSHLDLVGVTAARVGLVLVVGWGLRNGTVLAILGVQLGSAAMVLLTRRWLVFRRHGVARPRWDASLGRVIWSRGAHVGLGSVFGSISARSDVLLLKGLTDSHQVGLHGAAARVLKAVIALAAGVAAAVFPQVARSSGRPSRRFVWLWIPALGVMAISGVLALAAPIVIERVFGERLLDATAIARVLLVAGCLQVLIIFVAKAAIMQGWERRLPRIQALGAVANVSMNVVLIPRMGALGAAWATLLGDAIVAAALVNATVQFRRRPLCRVPGQT